jgi:hypothetical protein
VLRQPPSNRHHIVAPSCYWPSHWYWHAYPFLPQAASTGSRGKLPLCIHDCGMRIPAPTTPLASGLPASLWSAFDALQGKEARRPDRHVYPTP